MALNLESQLESILVFWFTTEDEWRTGLWFEEINPQIGVMSRDERKRI